MTARQPVERWHCPTCRRRVDMLLAPALAPPTCPHTGTPRHAAREVLMVRDDVFDGAGEE
jgi:hypothetical protein